MPVLFENTTIKSMKLKNRAIRSATWSGIGDQKGRVTNRGVEFYGKLADGDIGLIVTGF
jgi:2,4-dienoyl-CoA reductase-like NADH-dependent reductase (Old Yellow Enzyme family)